MYWISYKDWLALLYHFVCMHWSHTGSQHTWVNAAIARLGVIWKGNCYSIGLWPSTFLGSGCKCRQRCHSFRAFSSWAISWMSNHIYYCMFSFVKLLPSAVISCSRVIHLQTKWRAHVPGLYKNHLYVYECIWMIILEGTSRRKRKNISTYIC